LRKLATRNENGCVTQPYFFTNARTTTDIKATDMKTMVIEDERIKALQRYEILDTPPDGSFDRITALASKMFNMPIALITLVDHDRIWFKSKSGLEGVEQIDRVPGLCASAIFSKEVYLVENAIEDPRTLANPLVCGDFGLRFYAAAPLHTHDGHNLGTLCIIDKNQRYINREQMEMLGELAAIVMDEMELRLAARSTVSKSEQRIAELEEEIKGLRGS
jgi:GAF domain-containing protein